MNDTTFNKDPYIAAFQEGVRSVAVHIKRAMEDDNGLQGEKEEGER
jgi:hypothetical protein